MSMNRKVNTLNPKMKRKKNIIPGNSAAFRPILPAGIPPPQREMRPKEMYSNKIRVKDLLGANRRLKEAKIRAKLNCSEEDNSTTQIIFSVNPELPGNPHLVGDQLVEKVQPINCIEGEAIHCTETVKAEVEEGEIIKSEISEQSGQAIHCTETVKAEVEEGEIIKSEISEQSGQAIHCTETVKPEVEEGEIIKSEISEQSGQPTDSVSDTAADEIQPAEQVIYPAKDVYPIKMIPNQNRKDKISKLTNFYLSKGKYTTSDSARYSSSGGVSICSDVWNSDTGLSDIQSSSQDNCTQVTGSLGTSPYSNSGNHFSEDITTSINNNISKSPNKNKEKVLTKEKKQKRKKPTDANDANQGSALKKKKKNKTSEKKLKLPKPPQPLDQKILREHFVKGSYDHSGHIVENEADIERLIAVDIFDQVDKKAREAANLNNQLRYRANDYKAYIYQNDWLTSTKSSQQPSPMSVKNENAICSEALNATCMEDESEDEMQTERELLLEILCGVSNVVSEKRPIRHSMRNFFLKQQNGTPKEDSYTDSDNDSQRDELTMIEKDSSTQDSVTGSDTDTQHNQQRELVKDIDTLTVDKVMPRAALQTFSFTFDPTDDGDFDVDIAVSDQPVSPVFSKSVQKTTAGIAVTTSSVQSPELDNYYTTTALSLAMTKESELGPDCSIGLQKSIKQEPLDPNLIVTSMSLGTIKEEDTDDQLVEEATLEHNATRNIKSPDKSSLSNLRALTTKSMKVEPYVSNGAVTRNESGILHRVASSTLKTACQLDSPFPWPQMVQLPPVLIKTLLPLRTIKTEPNTVLSAAEITTEPRTSDRALDASPKSTDPMVIQCDRKEQLLSPRTSQAFPNETTMKNEQNVVPSVGDITTEPETSHILLDASFKSTDEKNTLFAMNKQPVSPKSGQNAVASVADITCEPGPSHKVATCNASLESSGQSKTQFPKKHLSLPPTPFQSSLMTKTIKTEPMDIISGDPTESVITIEPGPSHRENPLNKMLQQFADCIVENISIKEEADLDMYGLLHVDEDIRPDENEVPIELLEIEKQSQNSESDLVVSVKQEPLDSAYGDQSSGNENTRKKQPRRKNRATRYASSTELSTSKKRPIRSTRTHKKFTEAEDLHENSQNHMKSHNNEKPWACPTCGKCFARKDVMRRHTATHAGESRFKCTICLKKFSHRYELNRHKRTHSGEKKFQCGICRALFSQKAGLNRHFQTHYDEKPFTCNVCKQTFVRKNILFQHFRRRHKSIKAACPVCGIGFPSKSAQVSHLSSHPTIGENQCASCRAHFSSNLWLEKHVCSAPTL